MTEIDDARLAQLVGVRSSKTGYYARWRGTAIDLERALAGWDEAERRADEMARRNDQLRRAREQLARVRQAEALSAERHRIARDLHDGVAQCLVGIGMHLEWCRRHTDPDAPEYDRLVASKELARAGLGWVRSAVDELSGLEHPGTGLGQALRDLAADFRSAAPAAGVRPGVRAASGSSPRRSSTRCSRSARRGSGMWSGTRRPPRRGSASATASGQVRLSVADDGAGDPADAARYLSASDAMAAGRHGLRNMAERTAELDGVILRRRRRRRRADQRLRPGGSRGVSARCGA